MTIAVYARVSTDKQETENQILQLREYCTKTYKIEPIIYRDDDTSGSKTTLWQREKGKELLNDVKSKKIGLVLVWAIDRLTREGIDATRDYLNLLKMYNVNVISYTEPFLNTDNELIKNILIDVLAWVAKREAEQLSERTKAGLERVRKLGSESGKPIGAPRIVTDEMIVKMREWRSETPPKSYGWIAEQLKVNKGSVHNALKNGLKSSREKGGTV